ncbi:MAG: FeoC-like transcriptional regulator [Rhodospirillaceae bacterium]|nr:FeoC-like transcriptional regulator [Rhodospirillaceae bacterium]
MLLTDLRDYLSARKRASVMDLASHFHMENHAIEGLLAMWVSKGRVRRLRDHLPCGTCGKCESALTDIYEWIGVDGCPDPFHGRVKR